MHANISALATFTTQIFSQQTICMICSSQLARGAVITAEKSGGDTAATETSGSIRQCIQGIARTQYKLESMRILVKLGVR